VVHCAQGPLEGSNLFRGTTGYLNWLREMGEGWVRDERDEGGQGRDKGGTREGVDGWCAERPSEMVPFFSVEPRNS
jgi:hypothetical protein